MSRLGSHLARHDVRILITGSRDWQDYGLLRQILLRTYQKSGPYTLVHGAARGVDREAAKFALSLGCDVEPHPADWGRHNRSAGIIRNNAMVSLGSDYCYAFIHNGSPGASHCAGAAESAGIRTFRFETST